VLAVAAVRPTPVAALSAAAAGPLLAAGFHEQATTLMHVLLIL
jgi:hypothetical protein